MDLSRLIRSDRIIEISRSLSKKQFLEAISELAAKQAGLDPAVVFETLQQRERLGSTGLADGIAIPHGKVQGLNELVVMLARLSTPIDFDAPDQIDANLIFVLLAPEGAGADHLTALSAIARKARDKNLMDRVRRAGNSNEINELLSERATSDAA